MSRIFGDAVKGTIPVDHEMESSIRGFERCETIACGTGEVKEEMNPKFEVFMPRLETMQKRLDVARRVAQFIADSGLTSEDVDRALNDLMCGRY